ncbi:MAG: hypothetical protein E7231_07315 [Cellulosilyticum sp.]|nr:hypothetical protein [Cellulosilyticum sp.]
MHILERVENYVEEIKQKPYIYKIQKQGIEVFKNYIMANCLEMREEAFDKEELNKLILFWLPRNKKYLSEAEIYQVVYTIHDLFNYMHKEDELSTILELYGEEYMRIYKAKNLLQKMTKDPVISVDPIVIDLDKYRARKKKSGYSEIATTYEQALFEVQECKEGGQVILNKPSHNKQYKLLLEYPAYKYLRKGDIIHAVIKRKLFYVYWELEEIRAYYLPQALEFLKLTT